jgi:hypothetical protein
MSRDYIELDVCDYSVPTEWTRQRLYSTSSDPDAYLLSSQATSPGAALPAALNNNYTSEAAPPLLPPPRLGPRRYSTSPEPDIQTASGQSTPRNDNSHASWSTASLVPPPTPKSRLYYQMGISEASLGRHPAAMEYRTSTGSWNSSNHPSTIVRLHDRDDVEQWKGMKRYVYFLAPLLILVDVGFYLAYLGFRLFCNIEVQRTTGIGAGAAWAFFGVEFLITIPYLMNNGWAMFALKTRNRPRLRLVGNHDVPTVDVFITCCKEDNGVIMDTVRATCDQDYPIERFRVTILDDGQSAELRMLAHEAR